MILFGALIELFIMGSVFLAPLVALLALFVKAEHVGSRPLAWLGLATSVLLLTSFPAFTLLVAGYGSGYSEYYSYAPLFGVGSALLGWSVWRYNMDQLVHGRRRSRRLGYACAMLFVAIAVALLPWLWGAQTYIGGGEFAMELGAPPGDIRTYLVHVLPLGVALLFQAWVALRPGNDYRRRDDARRGIQALRGDGRP